MRKDQDLLRVWLESRRLRLAATTGHRRVPSRPPSRLVRLLVGTRLFWPVVRGLLWLSKHMLRLISRLYFDGWFAPRTTRRLLHISDRLSRYSLTLMRNRKWTDDRDDIRSDHDHRP
ncbi:hypothetical protein SAMN05216304_104208 [Bosea sp. OK403]|nr:hypothetical protein SAMN05216304_104208 [Bosea sp. OK403]